MTSTTSTTSTGPTTDTVTDDGPAPGDAWVELGSEAAARNARREVEGGARWDRAVGAAYALVMGLAGFGWVALAALAVLVGAFAAFTQWLGWDPERATHNALGVLLVGLLAVPVCSLVRRRVVGEEPTWLTVIPDRAHPTWTARAVQDARQAPDTLVEVAGELGEPPWLARARVRRADRMLVVAAGGTVDIAARALISTAHRRGIPVQFWRCEDIYSDAADEAAGLAAQEEHGDDQGDDEGDDQGAAGGAA